MDDAWVDEPDFYEQVLGALAAQAGHQDELRDAFELYVRAAVARGADDEDERTVADLIFEANLRIAAIEQVILDDAVTLVIDHVPRHYTARRRVGWSRSPSGLLVPRRIAQINSSRRVAGVAAVATDLWAWVMTDQVMVVAFPAETIRLGRDIPRRDWRRPFYAPTWRSSRRRPSTTSTVRPVAGGRARAGAGDWRRFDNRMNFVANLLRSRQHDPTLLWQPFTDKDVVRVWNGGYPTRFADPFEQAVRTPWLPDDLHVARRRRGTRMTVWTHDLLDELRLIGDPRLDRGRWRGVAHAPPDEESGDGASARRSGSSARGVGRPRGLDPPRATATGTGGNRVSSSTPGSSRSPTASLPPMAARSVPRSCWPRSRTPTPWLPVPRCWRRPVS